MICKIDNPAYVAPENDAWRHENSNSENEDDKIREMQEKKIRYWFVKDGKRKRTLKTSPVVPVPKVFLQRLAFKAITSKIGCRGKVQLKKKPQKKRKDSDEEDSTYTPTGEEKKKLKRKAVQTGVIPRNIRARKGGASMPESQSGKSEKHVATSKGPEAEKPEVQKKAGAGDDEVEIDEVRVSSPPPPPPESKPIPQEAESSKPKKTVLPDLFEGFPNIHGEYKDDILSREEFDMFHDAFVKALEKKVSILEKEKAKAEADRDELKKQLEELTKENEEIRPVMIKQAKKLKKMEGDVDDNANLFELLTTEISDLHVKNVKLKDINKTLNQLISELHEASANEFKAMKLEMEALRADTVVKDEQLNMLYTVMEHYLGIDVQSIYNNIKIKRVAERRIEREKRLAEEATQRKKDVIIETQEAGGSSSQADVETIDVEADQAQGFVLVGEATSLSYSYDDIIRLKVEKEEEKEDEDLDNVLDAVDNYDRSWDDLIDKDDDEDQGSTGLLIVNPSVQQKIDDFMNDEINEKDDD
ncbi:glutamic acid-rich protein-like [Helianthus annuus]|uniref:glutamic acid-rich protein-like n=1 Tax=Helianthus annuus TaxID=4232 RepID=UPI000B8F9AEE|nr:glutamic acid-rich protein-like [Helianthus annuus]